MSLKLKTATRRGDTLIEVMFAIGFFALVAIISVSVMNSGVNNAERDLELVTARNELNAQAEALRFIHSSYVSEKTLPDSDQQYKDLWYKIVGNAVTPSEAENSGLLNLAGLGSCEVAYDSSAIGLSPLQQVNAFVLNTRKINSAVDKSYFSINSTPPSAIFQTTDLSARLIFSDGVSGTTSDDQLTDGLTSGTSYKFFDQLVAAEGIWDFAVKDISSPNPKYYDFYIQTCWYGPRATRPTVLDTVIRLYNPENL